MHTQCPECRTIFRVSSQQLAAAQGKVRCGHCHAIFPARAHAVTVPRPGTKGKPGQKSKSKPRNSGEEPKSPSTVTKGSPGASSGTVPDHAAAEAHIDRLLAELNLTDLEDAEPPASSRKNTRTHEGNTPKQTQRPADRAPETATRRRPSKKQRPAVGEPPPSKPLPLEENELKFQPGTGKDPHGTRETILAPEKTPPADAADEPLPEVLRQPQKRGSGVLAVLFWSLASLLMLAFLGLQYAYHERYKLAQDPKLRPLMDVSCRYLNCALPPRRDTAAFELQERDVRFHPDYEGALLITGTFINHAPFAQPYPLVEVVLKDVNGHAVAGRRFRPEEYLPGVRPNRLLPPETEAQLLLEVSDPGNKAVSFEFSFL